MFVIFIFCVFCILRIDKYICWLSLFFWYSLYIIEQNGYASHARHCLRYLARCEKSLVTFDLVGQLPGRDLLLVKILPFPVNRGLGRNCESSMLPGERYS